MMPNPVKPFFISFEGIDFSGKSSMLRAVKAWLEERVPNTVVNSNEPGGTEVGVELRQTLLKKREEIYHPLSELFTFMALRHQNVHNLIIPNLELGNIVLFDRFVDSSYAMQHFAGDVSEADYLAIEEMTLKGFRPDLVIYLDICPTVSFLRQTDEERRKDRIEEKGIDYHHAVREGFLTRFAAMPDTTLILDGELPIIENLPKVIAVLEERFL
ncbi:Thymidylate kinase [compost metagenome]